MAKAQDLGSGATLRRLWRVYSRFWLVFAIFIPLACWLCPNAYPKSWSEFVLNFLSLKVSYNAEWWFLFPWAILLSSARWIVPFVRNNAKWKNVMVFIVLFGLQIYWKKWPMMLFGDTHFTFILAHLTFAVPPFFVGICSGCHTERWSNLPTFTWPSLIMLILVLWRMFLGTSSVNLIFAVPLILLFCSCQVPQWLQSTLSFFGRHSIYMWFTHTFYAYYLFHDQLYSLQYPIVMYVVLMAASIATSMILSNIYHLIFKSEWWRP